MTVDTEREWAVSWTDDGHPMQRASHALVHEKRVWLVDPVDDPAALETVESLGEVVAVLQLLDRHPRDCQALAQRYDVPLRHLPRQLPGTPFAFFPMVWAPGWREIGLWWAERSTLVVAESIGTAAMFAAGQRAGIHPMLRLRPPRALRRYRPDDLLPGHGPALHGGAAEAVDTALRRSRRDIPRAAAVAARSFAS